MQEINSSEDNYCPKSRHSEMPVYHWETYMHFSGSKIPEFLP